ncbi:hypothetical protein CBM2599_B30303 [Cupriavidus taiwanensis]|nr:hypothetical protein CBM2599_B30303 [Cupriavidus taiwanensis]SOY99191.1 hypothetical protein CBM2600_B40145 [Cupriavidus taiwanensis]SOY99215.1 hypothetical protein CBM2600_B50001 [Cupriavidus taiwanensis]
MDNPNEGVGSLLPAVSRGRLRLLRRLDCAGGYLAPTQPKAPLYDSQPGPQTAAPSERSDASRARAHAAR